MADDTPTVEQAKERVMRHFDDGDTTLAQMTADVDALIAAVRAELYGVGFLTTDCPTRERGRCRCNAPCALCRNPKHSAMHTVRADQPAGSPPWGHQWQPPR